MASPSYTYTLANSTTADASQVMQDFNDILNGVTDGTKDLSISALTVAGTATLNGHVNLGNSSADDLNITASLASSLPIKTNNSYDIGSSTIGLRKIYLGNGGAGATCDIVSASHATTREYTVPDCGAAANFVMSEAAQTINGVKTFGSGIKLPTSGGTAGSLDTYEEKTYSNIDFRGTTTGSGSTAVVSVYVTRIGRKVTISLPAITITSVANDASITSTLASPSFLDSRFRPTTNKFFLVGNCKSAGSTQAGPCMIRVETGGDIVLYRDGTGGSNLFEAGVAGLAVAIDITYSLA